jgi:hypothetical protein
MKKPVRASGAFKKAWRSVQRRRQIRLARSHRAAQELAPIAHTTIVRPGFCNSTGESNITTCTFSTSRGRRGEIVEPVGVDQPGRVVFGARTDLVEEGPLLRRGFLFRHRGSSMEVIQ